MCSTRRRRSKVTQFELANMPKFNIWLRGSIRFKIPYRFHSAMLVLVIGYMCVFWLYGMAIKSMMFDQNASQLS